MTATRLTRTRRTGRAQRGERGAILIHVAIVLIGLLAFSALTVDHGLMMVSRGQAQNAADAGAWAAGLYMSHDGGDQDGARAIAIAAAQMNSIWGDQPDIVGTDVTFPPCPPGAPGLADTCVKVDVFRNQRANGNPLPVFFASLVGVSNQGVQATATTQLISSGSAKCLLPFVIPDLWEELREDEDDADGSAADTEGDDTSVSWPDDLDEFPNGDGEGASPNFRWDPDDTFDRYVGSGPGAGDQYAGVVDLPSAFDLQLHHGMRIRIKSGNPSEAIAPGWYFPVALGCNGGNCYRQNIQVCDDDDVVVDTGDPLTNEPGNMIGPTLQGVNALLDDDSVYWNPSGCVDDGDGGCLPGGAPAGVDGMQPGLGGTLRIRPIAAFNVDLYDQGRASGRQDIIVSRILGLFVEDIIGNDVIGRLTVAPGYGNSGPLDDESSFLRSVIFVR